MSFKDSIANDIGAVFLNCDEFAEKHTVKYDGDVYENVSVVFTAMKQKDRSVVFTDEHRNNLEGLYLAELVAHFSISDVGGVLPEKGRKISFDDGVSRGKTFFRTYKIEESSEECGMAHLELEAIDE